MQHRASLLPCGAVLAQHLSAVSVRPCCLYCPPEVFDLLRVSLQYKLGKVGEQRLLARLPHLRTGRSSAAA